MHPRVEERGIFRGGMRARDVPVYPGTFTARANRESRAEYVKLSGEIKGNCALQFICTFNADNARFRA